MTSDQAAPPPYAPPTSKAVQPFLTGADVKEFLAHFWAWRSTLIMVFVPLFLLPLALCFEYDPLMKNSMRSAYVLILMIVLWATETLPLAVTALIPMVLYPLMSVVKASDLAPQYMTDSNMSFIGSILVIGAFERADLHTRFALRVLSIVGAKPRWLLAGFMFAAWFLSMWISDTMITVLFIPIAMSVNSELQIAMKAADKFVRGRAPTIREAIEIVEHPKIPRSGTLDSVEVIDVPVSQILRESKVRPSTAAPLRVPNYECLLILAAAYSATIGGCSTQIGSSHNFIISSQIGGAYDAKGCPNPLNFVTWAAFSLPFALIYLVLAWFWLLIYYCGFSYAFGCGTSPIERQRKAVEETIKEMYNSLPPFNNAQIVILGHCLVMVLLLATRRLNNDPVIGWEIIAEGFVKESTATILVAVSLFFFPTTLPYRDKITGKIVPPKPATNWKDAEKSFPLGIILLVGGGIAASYGAEVSGLATLMASLLEDLVHGVDDVLAVFILVCIMVVITQFMANAACVTLMLPVMKELADRRHSNPMLFMFPTGMASTFAYLLPAAAPLIAVVFQTGKFRIVDLLSAGSVMTVLGIGLIMFATTTYGVPLFNLYQTPWNVTADGTYICL